jgi:hypothetical protein
MAVLLLKYGRSDMVFNAGLGMDEAGSRRAAARRDATRSPTTSKPRARPSSRSASCFSTRADLLPPDALRSLSRLQDDVDAVPVRRRRSHRHRGARRPHLEGVLTLRRTPIAAASLGQVHRAALRDGREVAVKVQRPNIREQVLKDMETMGEVAAFLDSTSETGRRIGSSGWSTS